MKIKKIVLNLVAVAAFFGLSVAVWPYAFTVVPIEKIEALEEAETFDPAAYVTGIWDSRILPTFLEGAVDITTIINEMKPNEQGMENVQDLKPLAENYGLITVGQAHVYMVKGRGEVVSINTESSVGTMEVEIEGNAGPSTVLLYIGPRIPSDETSVRDAVGFISFGDFREQTEYGMAASEINRRVNQTVLEPLDIETLQGKTIEFYGAFTIRTFNLIEVNVLEIKVVPVKIDIVD
ncbi:MAG: DUF2291 domain-containing protein [Chloroflexota bacterium]|jgi:predicted lipoprotein